MRRQLPAALTVLVVIALLAGFNAASQAAAPAPPADAKPGGKLVLGFQY